MERLGEGPRRQCSALGHAISAGAQEHGAGKRCRGPATGYVISWKSSMRLFTSTAKTRLHRIIAFGGAADADKPSRVNMSLPH
jgi:hypothetical protein